MKRAIVTVDLGFGDAGKGSFVDAMVRYWGCQMVVRYSGGAQAAHNVVTPEGLHHTFAQLGAGSFIPGCKTYLGPNVVVNPLSMITEAIVFANNTGRFVLDCVHVDNRCLVTTPYHRAMNRIRELHRGSSRHGSCGMGVGETVSMARGNPDALRVRDLDDLKATTHKLTVIRDILRVNADALCTEIPAHFSEQERHFIARERSTLLVPPDAIAEKFASWTRSVTRVDPGDVSALLAPHDTLIFEGAHGLLIDEDIGFLPHTTWNSVVPQHAYRIMDEAEWRGRTATLGLLRTYSTRHGNGPFPSEVPAAQAGLPDDLHNRRGYWQGPMRCGLLDISLLRYAITAAKSIDGLAVSCMDALPEKDWAYATHTDTTLQRLAAMPFEDLDARTELANRLNQTRVKRHVVPKVNDAEVLNTIEECLGRPVLATSYGPTAVDKVFEL